VYESKLVNSGGQIAASDDGRWIAVENKEAAGHINIFAYESLEGVPRDPKLVHSMTKKPVALAVTQQDDATACAIALVERSDPGHELHPIEVFSVSIDGRGVTSLYRVRLAAACLSLDFCHGSFTHLLSSHDDGQVVVYNFPDGTMSHSQDGKEVRSISISSDRTIMASAERNYLRFYSVPAFEAP